MDIGDLFINQDYEKDLFQYKDVKLEILCSKSATTDFDLTGQIIWPAAIELSKFIIDNSHLFIGKNILELGAGAGLSGIVASKYAKNTIITDGNEIVANLIKLNIDLHRSDNSLFGYQFIWGIENSFKLEQQLYKDIPDWNGKIDIIIGADIIFWPQSIDGLAEVVHYFSQKNALIQTFVSGVKRSQQSEDLIEQKLNQNGQKIRVILDVFKEYKQEVYLYQIK